MLAQLLCVNGTWREVPHEVLLLDGVCVDHYQGLLHAGEARQVVYQHSQRSREAADLLVLLHSAQEDDNTITAPESFVSSLVHAGVLLLPPAEGVGHKAHVEVGVGHGGPYGEGADPLIVATIGQPMAHPNGGFRGAIEVDHLATAACIARKAKMACRAVRGTSHGGDEMTIYLGYASPLQQRTVHYDCAGDLAQYGK
ncbi:MAG: hypothetical protein FRX49_07532 [Trebouxia sp. A1-2]|nr:MAG: hypothetical protein FRX49_07532 [Trebouxia sp. A1-2]